MTHDYLQGIGLMLAGAYLCYISRKRKYDRRNKYGIEQHYSYRSKLTAEVLDRLILWAGYACLLVGSFMMFSAG